MAQFLWKFFPKLAQEGGHWNDAIEQARSEHLEASNTDKTHGYTEHNFAFTLSEGDLDQSSARGEVWSY